MATFCVKICMIQFLKDQMSSITSDLHEEILKANKSHKNCIIQIVSCKTEIQKRKICIEKFIKEKDL